LAIERRRVSCALAHIQLLALRRGFAASEGTPTKRELEAMITLLPSNADRADLMFLEHRVPLGWALAGLVFGGNVASAVLMLLGQG
jgi:hypothetical protein